MQWDFGDVIQNAFKTVSDAFGANPFRGAYDQAVSSKTNPFNFGGPTKSSPFSANPFQGTFLSAMLHSPISDVGTDNAMRFNPVDINMSLWGSNPTPKPEGVLVAPPRPLPSSRGGSRDFAYADNIAAQHGIDPAVLATILRSEGGGIGDNGHSFGPLQFYDKGQLPAFAKYLGTDIATAGQYALNNPEAAVDWALRPGGYLGDTIRQGMMAGLTGADLAVYASRHGQRSAFPDRLYSLYSP